MPSPFVPLLLDYATETTLALVRTAVDAINTKLPAALGRTAAAGSLSTALSTEDAAKVPALGQALAAGSVPVVLPAAQAAGPLALQAQLPAALGQAARASSLSVTQSTEDAAKVPSLGQALAAGCVPVVLPAAQAGGALALDSTLTGGTAIAIAKGAAATGAGVSGNPVYTAGIDGSGLVRPTLHSAAGNMQVSTAKGTSYSSAAAESTAVISASACSPSMVNVRNLTGTTRYVQFFNANGTPANGTVPKFMFMLTANSDQQKTFPCPTDRFSTAMTVVSSSTAGTLTLSAGTDLLIQVDLYPSST